MTGQEFYWPLHCLPAPWFLEKVLLALAQRINPSMQVRRVGSQPGGRGGGRAVGQAESPGRGGEQVRHRCLCVRVAGLGLMTLEREGMGAGQAQMLLCVRVA